MDGEGDLQRSWEKRLLVELEQGPLVYAYPGFMGAVCERLVEQGLVRREPWGEQFRYSLAPRGPLPLPTVPGGFKLVLADPAWAFRTYGGEDLIPTQGEQPYAPMSLEDMMALPVRDVCAPDCVLIMWTVSYLQDEASQLGRAWGFAPKSLGPVWVKDAMGMGYWFRQEVEISRLFTRGKPKRLSKGVRQVIRAPRRKHSQKPLEQYALIEALVEGPYLELFARPERRRRGWSYWGLEVDKFAEPRRAADATGCG